MGQVDAGLIEQHVAEAAAQHDAEGGPGQEVVHLQRRGDGGPEPDEAPHQAPADHQAGDIGEGIPADRQRAELDDDRVELRKQQDRDHTYRSGPLR